MNEYHIPVLLNEVIDGLNVAPGKVYIDATLGGGGHTKEMLKRGAKVIGIDQDSDAIEEAKKYGTDNLLVIRDNFAHLNQIALDHKISEVDGILFDLGVSSHQLETPQRGFSFNSEAPLDMRMDQSLTVTASDLINVLNVSELTLLFTKFGEERFAKRIASKIIEERAIKAITTTDELAKVILSVRKRGKFDRTHPATRIFQALRIAVNDELNSLKEVLPQAIPLLKNGGRIVVISFHSLEDRIVKNFIKEQENLGNLKNLTKKPIVPTEEEKEINPRSRSAKLRIAEK